MSSSQGRNFFLITYCSTERILQVLQNHDEQIEWYAFCRHDKDLIDPYHPDTSAMKKEHTHIFLHTSYPYPLKTVRNWFFDPEECQNTLGKISSLPVASCRYLMHLDDPDKHRYDRKDVWTNKHDFDAFIETHEDENDKALNCFRDFLDGLDDVQLLQKYGNYYVQNGHHIKKLGEQYCSEQAKRWFDRVLQFNKSAAEVLSASGSDSSDSDYFDYLSNLIKNYF